MKLSTNQIREFFEVGYTILPGVFEAAEIAAMQSAFDRLQATAEQLRVTTLHRGSMFVLKEAPAIGSGVRIERIVWCGAAEPVLGEFGRDPRLLAPAAALLGSGRMEHLINQAHFKLPHDGVWFPWHQDSTHRRAGTDEWRDLNGRGSYVQTLTALDDVNERNGPIEFLRGSCRLGHVPPEPGQEGRLPADLDERDAKVATMRTGDLLLFGPFTFHRSLPNDSNSARRVFINGFAYPGANSRVYPGEGAGRVVVAPESPAD